MSTAVEETVLVENGRSRSMGGSSGMSAVGRVHLTPDAARRAVEVC